MCFQVSVEILTWYDNFIFDQIITKLTKIDQIISNSHPSLIREHVKTYYNSVEI